MLREENSSFLHCFVEPILLDRERVWCVLDDGEAGWDAELIHLLSQLIAVRAGVVFLTSDQPHRRGGFSSREPPRNFCQISFSAEMLRFRSDRKSV